MKTNQNSLSMLVLGCLAALPACAQITNFSILDFETLLGGAVPTDGMLISNQFLEAFGISFAFTNGAFPLIAKVGSPATAFLSAYGAGVGSHY